MLGIQYKRFLDRIQSKHNITVHTLKVPEDWSPLKVANEVWSLLEEITAQTVTDGNE